MQGMWKNLSETSSTPRLRFRYALTPPDISKSRVVRNTGLMLTRLRLISGLTLLTFVMIYLLNHALGLVSLDVLVAGQPPFFSPGWRSAGTTPLSPEAFPGLAVATIGVVR